MDERRFDQITRALTGRSGRRDAIKTIFGTGVVGALGAFSLAETKAKKGKKNSKGKGVDAAADACNAVAVCRRTGQGEVVKCVGNCTGANSSSDCVCGNSPDACPDLVTCFACSTPNDAASCQQCVSGQVFCNGACVTGDCCADADCTTPGECQSGTGTCDLTTHTCSYPNAPDETTCSLESSASKGKRRNGKRVQVQPTDGICCSGVCTDATTCPCTNPEICDESNSCCAGFDCDNGTCVPHVGCQHTSDCTGANQICCNNICVSGVCCVDQDCSSAGTVSKSAKSARGKTRGLETSQICCDNQCVNGVCCTDADCPANQTCNDHHQCVPNGGGGGGGGGGGCNPSICSPSLCLTCNTSGQCVSLCPFGQTCNPSGQCVTIPSGCQTDADCGLGGICTNGICFVTSTCPAGQSNYECCRQAVKKACRHRGGTQPPHGNGHLCRKKGKKRCRQNFGNT